MLPKVKALAIIGLALALGAPAVQASTYQQRLDMSATAIAGKPVTVRCFVSSTTWDAFAAQSGYTGDSVLGLTLPGGSTNNISPGVCETVFTATVLGVRRVPLHQLAEAVDTLSHEANLAYLSPADGVDAQAEACAQRFEAEVAHVVLQVPYHTAEMRRLVAASLRFSHGEQEVLGESACPR